MKFLEFLTVKIQVHLVIINKRNYVQRKRGEWISIVHEMLCLIYNNEYITNQYIHNYIKINYKYVTFMTVSYKFLNLQK